VAAIRMLFTSRPLAGHFEPLLPLAEAAAADSHAIAFATGEPYAGRAREEGFESFAAGPDEDFRAEWAPRFPGFEQLVGDAQRRFFLTEIFANLELAPRADELETIVDSWRPDVIVHEVAELAAPLIGTARGIPSVDVSYGALIGSSLLQATGEAAAIHWRSRGLEPHPVAGLFRHLYVDTCPPSLQDPEIASVPEVQRLRPAAAAVPDADPPDWLGRLGPSPVVYLRMGTVWNRDLGVFGAVIDAVRGEDITLIVTVGRQNDPTDLGPQPPNVLVHRYVPQGLLLPRCDAVIAHGGAGTTFGALASGVPLLLLPQGADQYTNADRVVAAGAGRQILRDEVSSPAVGDALGELLQNPRYRASARRIQAEIERMPGAPEAVRRIEKLVDGSVP
jgi:UDP:flavonoid glycosyltransferase YjiC (YdhE family)